VPSPSIAFSVVNVVLPNRTTIPAAIFPFNELVAGFLRSPRAVRGAREIGSFSCPVNIVIYLVCLSPNSTVIRECRYSPTNTRKSYRKKLESKTIAVRPNLDERRSAIGTWVVEYTAPG
jgi:hypothetical protein